MKKQLGRRPPSVPVSRAGRIGTPVKKNYFLQSTASGTSKNFCNLERNPAGRLSIEFF